MKKEEEVLERIEVLLKSLVRMQVYRLMDRVIKKDLDKKIYQLTGEKGQAEIADELDTSSGTVSNVWTKLESIGLLEKRGRSYKKIID